MFQLNLRVFLTRELQWLQEMKPETALVSNGGLFSPISGDLFSRVFTDYEAIQL